MFQLIDGREYLWQWDINRQVKVEDPAIDEVHFCNRTSDCSLVVEVKDGVADIPNILLQQDFPIKVYAYLKDGYTKVEECLKVKSRTKPSDYIYTETEVLTVEQIQQQMTDLEIRVDEKITGVEETFSENIEDAVNDYLNSRPNIASVQYVDERIADHKHVTSDINNFDGRVSDLITTFWRDTGKKYVDSTSSEIQEAVAEVLGLPDGYDSTILGDIDQTLTDAKAYTDEAIDNIDLTGYADKVHFHTSYEVSDFTTRTNSLINEALKDVKVDLTGYATEEYVDTAIENIDIPKTDLTGYATEAWVEGKGYLTSIPTGYATKVWVNQQDFATEQYVNDAITNLDIPEADVDLSNYYTKEETDAAIYNSKDSYYVRIPSDISDDADNPTIAPEDLAEFATRYATNKNVCLHFYEYDAGTTNGFKNAVIASTAFNSRIVFRDSNIDIKNLMSNVPTNYYEYTLKNIDGVWHIYRTLLGSLEVATTEYVDNAIANIEIPEAEVDLTNYYTKAEVDTAIYNSKDAYYIDFSAATFEEQPATAEMIEFATRFDDNQNVCAHIKSKQSFSLIGWTAATINGNSTKGISFTPSSIDPRLVSEQIEHYYNKYVVKKKAENDWVYYIDTSYQFVLATHGYVDEAIANIEIPDVSNYQTEAQVNALINTALGVIENGTY